MTIQQSDSLRYEDEVYGVFAISEGQHLACEKCMRTDLGMYLSTTNHRGWIASFEIVDDMLVMGWNTRDRYKKASHLVEPEKMDEVNALPWLEGTKLEFTGSMLIVDGGSFCEFPVQLADAVQLYELTFIKGKLVEKLDLCGHLAGIRAFVRKAIANDEAGTGFAMSGQDMNEYVWDTVNSLTIGKYDSMYVWEEGNHHDCVCCDAVRNIPITKDDLPIVIPEL